MNRTHRLLARFIATISLLALAPATYAQSALQSTNGITNLGSWLVAIVAFIDVYIVPVVFALAFIVFVWGVYSTFIAGATNEEKRSEGQKLVIYSLIGFFLMFSVWGLVNLLLGTFGFNNQTRPDLPTFGAPGAASYQSATSPFSNTSNNNSNSSGTTGACAPDDYACFAREQKSNPSSYSGNCAPDDYACIAAESKSGSQQNPPTPPDPSAGIY